MPVAFLWSGSTAGLRECGALPPPRGCQRLRDGRRCRVDRSCGAVIDCVASIRRCGHCGHSGRSIFSVLLAILFLSPVQGFASSGTARFIFIADATSILDRSLAAARFATVGGIIGTRSQCRGCSTASLCTTAFRLINWLAGRVGPGPLGRIVVPRAYFGIDRADRFLLLLRRRRRISLLLTFVIASAPLILLWQLQARL
mmetsp:Transcript_49492/g.149158  ORF Transcript_49492/g.149158 Transcript_49492/m.149158 type:complete len:200 (+) Transcript_49492:1058-1657(+)